MCFYDVEAVDFALKFYPELDDVDWPTVSEKYCQDNWMQVIPKLITRSFWYPELSMDFGMPYREVAKLPRKQFALKILASEDPFVKVHFKIEQMEVWAGLRRPPTTKVGNVIYLGK